MADNKKLIERLRAKTFSAKDTILDLAHQEINALGGRHDETDAYAKGYHDCINHTLDIIEKLDGKDPLMLRAEIAELREALKPLADLDKKIALVFDGIVGKEAQAHDVEVFVNLYAIRNARAKLEGTGS